MCGPERLGEGLPSLSAIRGSFESHCVNAKHCLAENPSAWKGAGICLCRFAETQRRRVFVLEMFHAVRASRVLSERLAMNFLLTRYLSGGL